MEILLQDLLPGQEYFFQLRSKNQNGVSQWSRAYSFTADSDTTAPSPITGLSWVVSGASFVGDWTSPTTDSDGDPLKDFKDFKITMTASSSDVVFYVTEPRFDLSLSRNISSWGNPKPSVSIKVEVRDNLGNLSTPVTASATNAIPADIDNFNAEPILKGISLSWDPTDEDDLKQFEVYMSTAGPGFTPGPSNLLWSGTANQFIYTTANQIVHYFKARQVDLFNQGSANYVSDSATPQGTADLDTTPPSAPGSATVTSSSDSDGSSSIEVNWTSVGSSNLRNYIVRYSLDEVTWQYITVPSTDTSTVITGLLANTGYYVGVASSSYLSTRSSFTNAGTYPIITAADTSAPSTPSAPTVSTSTFTAQVNHDMTKAGGGDLESDVEYLEVHASTTTGFTPDLTTLRGTIITAGPGIDVSAVFEFSSTDSMTNLYWKVIAVDRAKNKSAPSAQATGLPGLIATANIANLAVTNAKVNDLSAVKLTAGTAFINDLFIRSNLVIDNVSGHIKSNNYDAGAQTGWTLDQNGLVIYNGTISASALQLQDSQNIAPVPFSDFEFNEDYYHNSSNVANIVTSTVTSGMLLDIGTSPRTGRQSIRVYNAAITNPTVHNYIFAPDGLSGTNANVEVNPGDYILSVYMKKNGTSNQNVKLSLYTDTGTSVQSSVQSVTSTSWTRYSAVLTVPSGAQKIKIYIEIGPQAANTGYDILLDSVQLERKLAGLTTASPWTPPSETRIDGGAIVTGSIRSSASSSTVPGQPAWSINTAGNMQIGDALIRGSLTVGAGSEAASIVQSGNYVANTTGWIIKGDGSVEFNSGLFRGELDISTTFDSKPFSVEVGNMPSSFVWYDGDKIDGDEPTVLFKGWSFTPDGSGGFDPVRDVQTVMRLTPLGEFQIIFDPSHTSDVLSVDGNNRRDASGTLLDRYYGWVDKRMGLGQWNDTWYEPNVEGRSLFSNTYYLDEGAFAYAPTSMGEYTETQSRIDGYGQADGSQGAFDPSSQLHIRSYAYDGIKTRNIIPSGYDLFDNAGGVSYYDTNTVRNRITINSVQSNLKLHSTTIDVDSRANTHTGLDCTLTSAGSGNHSIAFTPGSTTYNVTVAPGDRYYLAWYGYKPAAQSLTMRTFMKLNNGTTIYSTPWTFFSTSTSTDLIHNSNHTYELDDLLIAPSGVTSAHFGIELIGTVSSNQNFRISGVQLIKVFSETAGVKKLETNFNWRRFYPRTSTFNYDADGLAMISLNTTPVPGSIRDINNPKIFRHAEIEFWVREMDTTPGSLGSRQADIRINPLGMRRGNDGEYRLEHGEYRTLTSSTVVPANTAQKLSFTNNKVLDMVTGSTMATYWDDMGIVMDNTGGYTTFVPQRAGLFLAYLFLSWSPAVGSEYHVVELIKDSNGAILSSMPLIQGHTRQSASFVVPLSVGEKCYFHVYHIGSTKTIDTNSNVSFIQLL